MAVTAGAVGVMALLWRRGLAKGAVACLGGGLICLGLAAGGLSWNGRGPGKIAVMVDLSPSTRTATYRDGKYLRQRVEQLLGHRSYRTIFFAARNQAGDIVGQMLADMPAAQTHFAPPADADAVVLFSDARFAMPVGAPPTYIVVDPSLEQAAEHDSAVTDLRIEADQVVATVRGEGRIEGGGDWTMRGGRKGVRRFVRPLAADGRVTARVHSEDAWPENDALSMIVPVPWASQRWWVGADAPSGWRAMRAGQLPDDPAQWLAPAVVVLNSVPDSDLPAMTKDRLTQYVRDLGGGLVFCGVGQSHTITGAGDAVQRLSPLSEMPPRPMRQWRILLDASGSMNESAAGRSRWQWAGQALHSALEGIAVTDPVDVGEFSDAARWWVQGKSAGQVAAMRLPPDDVQPHGPTNLAASLEQMINIPSGGGSMPVEVMILTDAQTVIHDPDAIASRMKQAHMRLWVLATQHGSALDALRDIVQRTGGALLEQSQLDQWGNAFNSLVQSARGSQMRHDAVDVGFTGELAQLPRRTLSVWRLAWLKQGATLAAGSEGSPSHALAAYWRVGLGSVASAAFDANDTEINAMAHLVGRRPSDPRLKVFWTGGAAPRVKVDAREEGRYLNNLSLELSLWGAQGGDSSAVVAAIPQSGPGEYELAYAAPRHETIATVLEDGRPVDRFALAGRYAREFDHVGNDHAAMRQLVDLTGGEVISPRQTAAIDFHGSTHRIPLESWAGILAAALIAAALLLWRR